MSHRNIGLCNFIQLNLHPRFPIVHHCLTLINLDSNCAAVLVVPSQGTMNRKLQHHSHAKEYDQLEKTTLYRASENSKKC